MPCSAWLLCVQPRSALRRYAANAESQLQVMGVIQSILVQMALKYGLGRREQLVSASDFALYEKVCLQTRSLFSQVLTFQVRICGANTPHCYHSRRENIPRLSPPDFDVR